MPVGDKCWVEYSVALRRRMFQKRVFEIKVPLGASVATVREGDFDEAEPNQATVGLLIGAVYRIKVTNIPQHEGA